MQPTARAGRSAAPLATAFLALSAALCVGLLAVRNLYDDEILSLDVVTLPFRRLIGYSSAGDIHPPGMYLLGHAAWLLVPSFRWMNLLPALAVYAGLAVFVWQVTPLLEGARARLCFLLLAALHPQLLLWGGTFRWYSWWTGLSLLTLTVALQPRGVRPALTLKRGAAVGLMLAALFYLNYVTLLFALALAVAMALRYSGLGRRQTLARAGVVAITFVLLIAPQVRTMLLVHLPDGRAQRSNVLFSTMRLIESIAMSEAYLPWHPLALAAAVVFVAIFTWGATMAVRSLRSGPRSMVRMSSGSGSILFFGLMFFVLVAISGLGGKPRNALLLIPLAAFACAQVVSRLRPRTADATLLFFAAWIVIGVAHLYGRYGLAKASMNDHPEEVIALLRAGQAADPPACSIVVTYDSGLAFSVAQANLPRTMILSPYRGANYGGGGTLPASGCGRLRLYGVQSYVAGSARRVAAFQGEVAAAEEAIAGPAAVSLLSHDRDAATKRLLARIPVLGSAVGDAAMLPDYRFVVTSGAVDGASLERIRARLPSFFSSAGQANSRAADAVNAP